MVANVGDSNSAKWAELQQAKMYAIEDLEACKRNGDEKMIAQAERNLADIKL